MRRTLILLGVLLALGGLYFVLQNKEDRKIDELKSERSFGIEDRKLVERVVIKNREKEDLDFRKVDRSWYVNDSVLVWPPQMRTLLASLESVAVDYTPPKALVPTMKKSFEEIGIQVIAYDKKGRELTNFMIGGVTPDERGTYGIKTGATQPFILHVPLIEGGIRKRFDLTAMDVKSRDLFLGPWTGVEKVSVDYPHKPSSSFVLTKEGDSYSVRPIEQEGRSEGRRIGQGEAEAYLMHFERLGFEAFERRYPKKDSLRQLQPYATITVKRDGEDPKWVKLYPLSHVTGDVDLSQEFYKKGELFRYLGDVSNGDFILIQQLTIGKALRTYESFNP